MFYLRNDMKISLIALSMFLSFGAVAAENSFFNGYTKGCEHTKEYMKFQQDLCKIVTKKDGSQSCQAGKVTLPSGINGNLAKVKNNGDHTLFEVTLNSPVIFAGNTIVAIEQWSGHGNGIWGTDLVTTAKDVNEAKNNVKTSGTVFKKQKSEVLGSVGAEVVKGTDKKIRIMCDTSN